MSRTLTGFFTDDPRDLLVIAAALDALERQLRRDAVYLPTPALEMRARVSALLGSETTTRRQRNSQRNPHDPATAGQGIVVTVNEAAEVLGKSRQMVRRDCVTGRLTAVKTKDGWLITSESVEELLANREMRKSA